MGNGNSILVVDDEETTRMTLEELLSREGYEVTLASNGREALNRIEQRTFDVAVVDLVMPDIDGMTVLEEIKRLKPETHTIIVTGFGTIESAVEAMKKGASNYISKPFKKNEIQNVVKRVLEEAKFKETFKKTSEEISGGFEVFRNLINQGATGICITTRGNPDTLAESLGLEMSSIIKLTGINDIKSKISEFTRENENSVILLDGFEDIMVRNSIETMKKFMSDVNESLSLSNSKLLMSYNPNKIDPDILRDFKREVTDSYADIISENLSDPIRRDVIRFLFGREYNFTTIMEEVGVKDPPKLSFHLKKLKSAGILGQHKDKKYFLTKRGEKARMLLTQIENEGIKDMQNILFLKS